MTTFADLQQQVQALSEVIGQLSQQIKEFVTTDTTALIEQQTKFIKSIALVSGTLAPFSLLLLQSNLEPINNRSLLLGFSILVSNVLFAFIGLRFWLFGEYLRTRSLVEILKQKIIPKSIQLGNSTAEETQAIVAGQLSDIATLQNNLARLIEMQEGTERYGVAVWTREAVVWLNLILLVLGGLYIINSFLGLLDSFLPFL